MFSSRSFIVSGLTFRSLIHFEFILVYGVRKWSSFILLQVVDQISQHHLLKRLSLIHCIFLPPLSKIRCPYVRGFISGLSILFHWSISFKNKSQIKLLLSLKLCHGSFSSVWKSLWRLGNLQLPTPSAFWLLHCPLHPPRLFHKLWFLCCSSNIPNTLTRQGLCTGCHPCLTHSIHKNLSNSFNIFKSNVKCHLFNEAHPNLLKKKKKNTVCSLFSKTCYQSTIYPT